MNKQHINTVLINQNRIKQLMRMRKLFTESIDPSISAVLLFCPFAVITHAGCRVSGLRFGLTYSKNPKFVRKYFLINARERREAFWRKPRHTRVPNRFHLPRGAGVEDAKICRSDLNRNRARSKKPAARRRFQSSTAMAVRCVDKIKSFITLLLN